MILVNAVVLKGIAPHLLIHGWGFVRSQLKCLIYSVLKKIKNNFFS